MICHLLSELVLFSSKLSYTKSAKYKQHEAITRIPPGNCPQSKVSKVSSSFNPQLPSFVDDWGTSQQSMVSKAEAPKRKTAGFSGSRGCEMWWENIFFTFWFIWYCFISLFFTLWQTCWSLSFPKTKWLICINIRYKITDWLVLNQAHDEITRFFFFLKGSLQNKTSCKKENKSWGCTSQLLIDCYQWFLARFWL